MIFIIALVALSIGYYFIQKDKIRREERRDRIQEKQEELIELLKSRKEQSSKNK